MTPEEKRIAIAKACGWSDIKSGPSYPLHGRLEDHRVKPLPDYLNDLNAIKAAEDTLTNEEYELYGQVVIQYAMLKAKSCTERGRLTLSATAAQRAEAFLKVKGIL